MIYSLDDTLGEMSPQAALERLWGRRDGDVPTPNEPLDGDLIVPAQVSARQWMAICPVCVDSATAVSATHALFFCLHCLNAASDGRWLRVAFPSDLADVEARVSQSATESWPA